MRTTTWIIELAILCGTGMQAQAQEHKGEPGTGPADHACMMMSDSIAIMLGLTAEQLTLVKASDTKCMKACTQADGTMGTTDQVAMTTHDAELKRILTAEQYTRWVAMCNTSKAALGTPMPTKN